MFTFDANKMIPRFLLDDRNGYAIAKAIEAAMNYMNNAVKDGVTCATDTKTMPEWRLDELAWEYNIPYDYTADIAIKRKWIAEAVNFYRLYGTPSGILNYMAAYFDEADIEESWDYGGQPFHFRMKFPDSWTPDKVAWATRAIAMVKNVRSILDSYNFNGKWPHNLFVGCALYTYENGTYHLPAVEIESDWYIDELGDMLLDEDGILLTVEGATT